MSNLLPPLHDASFPMPNLLSLLYDANYPMPNFCHHYPMPPPIHKLTLPDGHLPLPDGHFMIISAQKPRFCARNARKRGFPTPKAHKNLDFVLETPENEGSKHQKRTKTPILCSKCPKTRVPNPKSAQKPRFCAREEGDWHQGERKSALGSIIMAFLQITAHASKTQMPHSQIINFLQRAR